jgi:4,5-DOPA dioxygenase extradiol
MSLPALFVSQGSPMLLIENTAADDFLRGYAKEIANGAVDDLVHFRAFVPHAVENHPTEEHLLPLFISLGAAGAGRRIHSSYRNGVLSMDTYAFN